MSARTLMDHYGLDDEAKAGLFSARRPQSVPLARAGLPGAMLRDQKPMSDGALRGCLQDGLTPRDWYELLNTKTFFWLSPSRIWRLLGARAYRDSEQVVLTLDTAGVVGAHGDRIWLSPINSGSTLFSPQPRGMGTFRRIGDYPHAEWFSRRGGRDAVVELVVDDAVPDVADHVLAVHSVKGDAIQAEVWRSPKAGPADHP